MYGSHKGVDLNNWENGELTVDERQQQENPKALQQAFYNRQCI